MKEKTKLFLILGIVLAISVILIILVNNSESKDQKIMETFNNLMNSRKYEVLYISQSNCNYCQTFEYGLKDVTEAFNIKYTEITIDELLASSQQEIFERLQINTSEFKTPYVAIVKEGQIVQNNNYLLEDELLELFKTYNLVEKEAKLPLNYLHVDNGYYETIKENNISIIGFASVSNYPSATQTFKDVLSEITIENKIVINYLELSFDTEEDYDNFTKSLDIFKDGEFSIPLLAIVKNNKVIDYINSTTSKQEMLTLLKDNKIIK